MSSLRVIKTLFTLFFLALLFPVATQGKEFVVVIDPGHGGKDAGALGRNTNEKTVNLEVAKKLNRLINADMPDARVHMTRDKDFFVPLQKRADFANEKHADIFISIHANSVDAKSPMRTQVNGAAVYTLGLQRSDTNLSVAMRENSVMKLEPDYTTTYQGFDPSSAESYIAFEMMQHNNIDQSMALAEAVQTQLVRTAGRKNNGVRQAPFWVLVRTSMPAILVELDFICNPKMEKFMASEEGQEKLAKAIYNGIVKYRKGTPKTTKTSKEEVAKKSKPTADAKRSNKQDGGKKESAESQSSQSTQQADEIIYKIQFLTASTTITKGDKRLKGLTPVEHYKDGGAVKYTYGSFTSLNDANKELKKVKKLFPDAFVIKTRDGKRIK